MLPSIDGKQVLASGVVMARVGDVLTVHDAPKVRVVIVEHGASTPTGVYPDTNAVDATVAAPEQGRPWSYGHQGGNGTLISTIVERYAGSDVRLTYTVYRDEPSA